MCQNKECDRHKVCYYGMHMGNIGAEKMEDKPYYPGVIIVNYHPEFKCGKYISK